MEWFRYYTRTLDSRKVQRLSDSLFRAWVNLCCLARIHDGPLPPLDEICFRLRVNTARAGTILRELEDANLLDRNEDGSIWMHDWQEHQRVSDNVAARVAKHRVKRVGNVTVTASERESRTDTEQSRADTEAKPGASAPTVRVRADRFAEFIASWPRVKNPDHALRAWMSCVETEDDEKLAFAARDRYLASEEVERKVYTDATNWILDQKSAKWAGKWPPGKAAAPTRKLNLYNGPAEPVEGGL